MNRREADIGAFTKIIARILAERTIAGIAVELELLEPVEVPAAELVRLAYQLQLDRPTRRSFVDAGLFFMARDVHDAPIYCAVRISETIKAGDLLCARRNAELLQQATGIAARAVAAGDRCEDSLEWDGVVWFQLEDL